MKTTLKLFIFLLFITSSSLFAVKADDKLKSLIDSFVPEYKALEIPKLVLSYEENLKNIQKPDGIARQEAFYSKYNGLLHSIPREELSEEGKIGYDYLDFEIALDKERISLEKGYTPLQNSPEGLAHLPNGKKWYEYYVKKWTSKDIQPQELLDFGKKEVARIRKEMMRIQKSLGYEKKTKEFYAHLNGPSFVLTQQEELEKELMKVRAEIHQNLSLAFEKTDIPLIAIKPIKNPTKDSPPGYYDEGTFFYNFFENKFQSRALEWLFIHEAVPGHHYQGSVAPVTTSLQNLFWHPGFSEGWGAYAENLGKNLKVYQDPYQYYGKWEWDLVRSARVTLDVGINYLGWDKEKAKAFWKENVPNQEGIMQREVDRMFRWPAQVLSYKVGERTILDLRDAQMKKLGKDFDLKRFHTEVLKRGTLPLKVLSELFESNKTI